MENAPGFYKSIIEVVGKSNYAIDDLGIYLQPLENGRACHFEFTFYYDPDDRSRCQAMQELYKTTTERLLDMGAYFNRPYGPIAEMAYRRNGDYAATLKRVKKLFDPNYVLNPGNLCY